MIVTYYPSSKNTHNLKDMEFKFFKNSKYFLKLKIFKSPLPHVNGVEWSWHIKQSCSLWYNKQNLK
jgi:hypothetical protein